jgi:hypothetical protein
MINHSPAQLIAELRRLMDMDYELLPGARHVLEEAIAVIWPLAEKPDQPPDDQELEQAPIIPGRNPRSWTITESVCTCLVMTGGHLDAHPSCPVHGTK